MASRISCFGRRLLKFQGFQIGTVSQSLRNSHSSTSVAASRSILAQTFIPPSSIDAKEVTLLHKNYNSNVFYTPPRLQILDKPVIINNIITELPIIKNQITYEDKMPDKIIEDPKEKSQSDKHAIRMIVIRRRKMRIHKLKKLRKKMHSVWMKIKTKRKSEKEKNFQAELIAQVKEAQKFDPLMYVREKIKKADEEIIPKLWKGKRLPEFVIKELLERRKNKIESIKAKMERRKNMNLKSSDYK